MNLIIQIPCYNEAETLPQTLASLPRSLPGFSSVGWLVIDDGSRDGTVAAARACGADEVLALRRHSGLGRAFAAGLKEALRLGADVIVNTDADGQYDSGDIIRLLQPILQNQADLVVGDRGVGGHPGFSPFKRTLQALGSRVVSCAADIPIPDAASGFRAFSRRAAQRTRVAGRYSYTLETLIQAGAQGWRVVFVPVRTHPTPRPSRLMRGWSQYLFFSAFAILRAFVDYRLLRLGAAPPPDPGSG